MKQHTQKHVKKILYTSDEAASLKTITGWVSSSGRFFGDDEHLARWEGCTHIICDCACGAEVERRYTSCSSCRYKAELSRYQALEFKEWQGEPLTLFNRDEYFWDEDEIIDYCETYGLQPAGLMLVICEPILPVEIDPDVCWSDLLPEGESLRSLDPELWKAFDALNDFIQKYQNPLGWRAGNFRTSILALDHRKKQ